MKISGWMSGKPKGENRIERKIVVDLCEQRLFIRYGRNCLNCDDERLHHYHCVERINILAKKWNVAYHNTHLYISCEQIKKKNEKWKMA